jgi:hypothetical protein
MSARTATRAYRPAEVSCSVAVFTCVSLEAEILGGFPHLGVDVAHVAILPHLSGEE